MPRNRNESTSWGTFSITGADLREKEMQISKKADYALRAMTLLAALPPERTMQAQEMAEAGKIPIKFLEQILLILRRG